MFGQGPLAQQRGEAVAPLEVGWNRGLPLSLRIEAQALDGIDVFHSSCERALLMEYGSSTYESQSFLYLTALGVTDEKFEMKHKLYNTLFIPGVSSSCVLEKE